MGDILSTIILGITLGCIVIGFLLGLLRGRNRAILRFFLVAGCAVGAFFLKDVIISTIMGVKIEGQTLEQMFIGMLGEQIPEFAMVLITSLIKVILGLVVFLVLFLVMQFITWVPIFPILKIFVKKGLKKGSLFGGIVGILQGVLVAFVICSPITGAITQVDKISKLTIQGETVGQMAQLPDMSGYLNSSIYKIYNKTGSWFFDAITTYKDQNGNDITLDETIDAADTSVKVLEEVNKIQESLNNLGSSSAEGGSAGSLRDVASSLQNMHEIIEGTSDGGKVVINSLIDGIKEMVDGSQEGGSGDSEVPDQIVEVLDKLDIEEVKLDSAAEAIMGVADYLDLQSGEIEEVPEGTAEKIVSGLADNAFVLDVLGEEPIVDLNEEHDEEFRDALNNAEIDDDAKNKIATLLGIKLN